MATNTNISSDDALLLDINQDGGSGDASDTEDPDDPAKVSAQTHHHLAPPNNDSVRLVELPAWRQSAPARWIPSGDPVKRPALTRLSPATRARDKKLITEKHER